MNFPQLEKAISEYLRENGYISFNNPLLVEWVKDLGGKLTNCRLFTRYINGIGYGVDAEEVVKK